MPTMKMIRNKFTCYRLSASFAFFGLLATPSLSWAQLLPDSAAITTNDANTFSTNTSTITQGQIEIGASGGTGSLTVSSGSLTVNTNQSDNSSANYAMIIGQLSGNGTITVTGGSLTINDGFIAQTYFGNAGGSGTVDVSGGSFILNSPSGLETATDGTSSATLNVSGGMFDENVEGASFNASLGTNTLSLSGNGIFELSNLGNTSSDFNLGSAVLNFASGSTAEFSVGTTSSAASSSFFNNLIAAGNISVGGVVDTNPSDFAYSSAGNQGILSLATPAAAPEPSTWALMIGGFASLLFLGRMRRKANGNRLIS
jgi:hypothetical protein